MQVLSSGLPNPPYSNSLSATTCPVHSRGSDNHSSDLDKCLSHPHFLLPRTIYVTFTPRSPSQYRATLGFHITRKANNGLATNNSGAPLWAIFAYFPVPIIEIGRTIYSHLSEGLEAVPTAK